ncbi:hypothetical protein BTN49_3191 [Candidatus Enterovibrio escicola]|uniref:Uncharacterized protein n=1 Tax=Candidatus Enterovibrio escicola TaxID=1927127 RepID=A0A2A5SZH6_9GAMM|nr:hypothetical protein BTN49_3191 [Candidatus Enterovibrio escacola]
MQEVDNDSDSIEGNIVEWFICYIGLQTITASPSSTNL